MGPSSVGSRAAVGADHRSKKCFSAAVHNKFTRDFRNDLFNVHSSTPRIATLLKKRLLNLKTGWFTGVIQVSITLLGHIRKSALKTARLPEISKTDHRNCFNFWLSTQGVIVMNATEGILQILSKA
jgi:hypothetical protein